MSDDIYQRLRKAVARHSAYFQATASGLEIRFLRKLFTEEEAEIYLNLTGNLETADQIAERAAQDPEAVAATLKRMAKKGLVFPKRVGETYYYAAAPFAHGILEHQVHTVDKELAQIYEDYMWAPKLPEDSNDDQPTEISLPLRSLPVKVPINISRPVAPYEDVKGAHQEAGPDRPDQVLLRGAAAVAGVELRPAARGLHAAGLLCRVLH